jgi:hypothetical protein
VIQYRHLFVTETIVVIISCCARVNGSSGDIRTPKVEKA